MTKRETSNDCSKNELEEAEVRQCNVATIPSPWLKQSQARAYLQIGMNELVRKLDTGEIKSVRRGNTRFVHTSWLDEWMLKQPSGAKVPAALVG